jgi:hypothetical protein
MCLRTQRIRRGTVDKPLTSSCSVYTALHDAPVGVVEQLRGLVSEVGMKGGFSYH